MNVRDSNTEQQIHENQSHEHKKDEKKYFSSQSSLLNFHEAVGEVQFAHQHCQHLHEGVVQSVEAIRVWEEGVEHETEGDDEYPEGEEKSEGGHSNSPGPESSRTDQNISGIINLVNTSIYESNQSTETLNERGGVGEGMLATTLTIRNRRLSSELVNTTYIRILMRFRLLISDLCCARLWPSHVDLNFERRELG